MALLVLQKRYITKRGTTATVPSITVLSGGGGGAFIVSSWREKREKKDITIYNNQLLRETVTVVLGLDIVFTSYLVLEAGGGAL